MPDAELLITAKGLTVARGGRRILSRVDLGIRHGDPYAIVGESGSGKTTLLMCLVGVIGADEGEVTIAGRALQWMPARERARAAGLVFQDYQLFPHLTVIENVMLGPRLHDPRGDAVAAAGEALASLGIADLRARHPHEISGGQKQRVAIARAIVLRPRVLFLDEPSAALDERTTAALAETLIELNRRTQIVIVSHDRPFLERCCRRGMRLAAGRVTASGDLGELFDGTGTPR